MTGPAIVGIREINQVIDHLHLWKQEVVLYLTA